MSGGAWWGGVVQGLLPRPDSGVPLISNLLGRLERWFQGGCGGQENPDPSPEQAGSGGQGVGHAQENPLSPSLWWRGRPRGGPGGCPVVLGSSEGALREGDGGGVEGSRGGIGKGLGGRGEPALPPEEGATTLAGRGEVPVGHPWFGDPRSESGGG